MRDVVGLTTWLKERRLERTHRKLKHLRAIQARLRDQEADLQNSRKAGASAAEIEARRSRIHDEREKVTREIHDLQAEEERLKVALKAS